MEALKEQISANPLSETNAATIVCHECDLSVTLPSLKNKQKALCPRCGFQLTQKNIAAHERIIAFGASALIFLMLSIPFEFLAFSAQGQGQSINILNSVQILAEQDYAALAIIQLLAIIVLPCLILLGLLYILIPIQFNITAYKSGSVLKWVYRLIPWSMAEIFLVGVLVSLIKISSMADIRLGLSFYAYIGFTICMTVALLHLDKHQLTALVGDNSQGHSKKLSAKESIQRTWALLATSVILYVPANVLPIMHTRLLGNEDPSTILGGVVLLWQMGSYPIAIVIFIASVFVPVGKLLILIWLNYSVQKGFDGKHSERIFLYRVTEFIGRWSMVDVFVVAILVSLIQLGNTMSIYPGHAALAFCGVVILTMLAAMSFDSRLIWSRPK
jgi:paraquat-inducible protein A